MSTAPEPWVSPSGSVRLELVQYKDARASGVEAVVLGYHHGYSQLYPLPGSRSTLLKASRIPASTPLGRSMRDWLAALVTKAEPEQAEVDPQANTRTII